ncbi:pimeloyl-ACP methyl ester carboxylesterase [Pseudoduganella flava]|uniref:Alpha/beta fold hydrolase n=1 Tax=Pseudoduganella flava TaxID=871742 RepID=A0A562Q0H3_9BURK|nr:alpha/beta hydrolase [Pseudoduganella flava]QGZ38295.1 alpha/beta fold hydrolase [Pseudoduganella flava]TWI50167.1 pimeloyl-ACP methyl ester carboxylesterase [Pseudoduganella flava]
MKRRDFLTLASAGLAAATLLPAHAGPLDAAAFRAMRRYADLPCGRIAYVERGTGPAALFLHGAPLNGYQWRGAIERLSPLRRCIAPDFMGLGYSAPHEGQSLAPAAQLAMLVALLDKLGVQSVDIVASDSGGAVAQLFAVHHPARVRSLLLTNCDVEPDSPPAGIAPVLEMARAGTLADMTARWLDDTALARSTFGAAVYHDPATLTAETIACYVEPLVATPLRRAQYHAFHVALAPNPLAGVEASLRRSRVPVRIVWGGSDTLFARGDAQYLDSTFSRSRGIRFVPDGKLFFQEEYPEVIALEARGLWGGA